MTQSVETKIDLMIANGQTIEQIRDEIRSWPSDKDEAMEYLDEAHMMNRPSYYAPKLYQNPVTTLDILNKLKQSKQVAQFEAYENGELLSFDVLFNEDVEHMLRPIIDDLYEYSQEASRRTYPKSENVSLVMLVEDHLEIYSDHSEILWDKDSESFVFRGMLETVEE